MFRLNSGAEQQSLFGIENRWSDYQQKRIKNSWVGFFHDYIFPKINESSFSVLYSEKKSRPNTPVNVLVGLLIIKSITGKSDEELMDSFFFDERVRYALHVLNDDINLSKNMIGNFRSKVIEYKKSTNIDLIDTEIRELNDKLIEMCNLDKSIERMDSMMISASCKRLSRIELIYTINYNLIKALSKLNKDLGDYSVYLEEGNKNDTIYRTKTNEEESKLETLLNHSLDLYDKYKDDIEINNLDCFLLLKRLIEEQYDQDNKKPKDGKDISPTSLQTPVDPDATYRYKYEGNVGYVANIVETVDNMDDDKTKVLITNWEINQNITSDKEMLEHHIEKNKNEKMCENITEITDGAYYSKDLKEKAKEANITLHPTELSGKKGKNTNLSEFDIDDKNHQVLACPNGQVPTSTKYDEEQEKLTVKFDNQKCMNCIFRDKCCAKIQKKATTLCTSSTEINRAQIIKESKNEEYQKISNIRAGIEGIPSVLRRKYHIDTRPNKGKLYLELDFSTAIIAINIKRTTKIVGISEKISVLLQNLLQNFKIATFFKNIN